MFTFDIDLNQCSAQTEIEDAVESTCRALGLIQMIKTDLSKYPGSTHWHYKLGSRSGTLEVTYWPQEQRAWLSIHHNRHADWMDGLIPQLKTGVEEKLGFVGQVDEFIDEYRSALKNLAGK